MEEFLFNNCRVPLKEYVTSLGFFFYKSANMIACDAACLSLAYEQAHLREFGVIHIRELQQRRRRRQIGRQKSNMFITQNNKFARASHFFVHVFTVLARLDVKMPNCKFY